MSPEQATIQRLFKELMEAPLVRFPEARGRIEAPTEGGVYIIYGPRGRVLHVGRTYRGEGGIRRRLNNHLHAGSSFTNIYLNGDGARLRLGCKFRYLPVKNVRQRALLESYASGYLCPAHIGASEGSRLDEL